MIGFLLSNTIGKWLMGGLVGIAIAGYPACFLYGKLSERGEWKSRLAAERAEWIAKAVLAETVQGMQRASDSQALSEYESQIKELQHALKDADRICFDGPDADRVRDLWKAKPPKAQR